MSATLFDLPLTVGLSDVIGKGRVLKILRDETKDILNINLELDELVPMTELLSASEMLSAALGTEVTIYPKYHMSLFRDRKSVV